MRPTKQYRLTIHRDFMFSMAMAILHTQSKSPFSIFSKFYNSTKRISLSSNESFKILSASLCVDPNRQEYWENKRQPRTNKKVYKYKRRKDLIAKDTRALLFAAKPNQRRRGIG